MTPFATLSRAGQTRRLRRLASDVIRRGFCIDIRSLRVLAAHSFNTMFRVDTPGGAAPSTRLVLRVGESIRIHRDEAEQVEAAWLSALVDETGVLAPQPVRGPDGESTRRWAATGVDAERVCTLFTWVDGRRLRENRTEWGLVEMGRLAALLHQHGAAFGRSAGIGVDSTATRAMKVTRPVYLGGVNLVPLYESPHGSLFVEALDRVQQVLDALWADPPHRPHLVHGDLGPHNVLAYRNNVRPIDFQDLFFGFDVQDLAITVADLRRSDLDAIEPFRRGYESIRPWPLTDPHIEDALVVGRSLNVMNLGLHLRRSGIERFLTDHSAIVSNWMTAG